MTEQVLIHTYDDILYIRVSECPENERAALTRWMVGQTAPLIPGLDPQDAVYLWDYEQFKRGGKPFD